MIREIAYPSPQWYMGGKSPNFTAINHSQRVAAPSNMRSDVTMFLNQAAFFLVTLPKQPQGDGFECTQRNETAGAPHKHPRHTQCWQIVAFLPGTLAQWVGWLVGPELSNDQLAVFT